ncbi:unnamed protein product [Dovyalis caffra]|uniref:F-box associated beta-propeller type 1 domain-containing protein n=1 Tax=Dovyalis caffra TaxID=77055 RepID=A0AAV1QY25_9ROSI|nr:unnamed protein product [Dovyalis caffra]
METIGKCRLLSKECNSITYESTFTDLHIQRTNTLSGFFIQNLKGLKVNSFFVSNNTSNSYRKLSLNFLPDRRVAIEASTKQGILLCRTNHPRYYVCKPTTKQWQRIPNPKTRYETVAIGMLVIRSKPLHYKIVKFSLPKVRCHDRDFFRYYCHRCELFDSKTWTWKQLEEVKMPKHESLYPKSIVSVSGSLHWLTWVKNIFAFHVNEESYSMFSLPLPVSEDDNGTDIALVEYEGKLAVTYAGTKESSMELWVMENYEKKEWNKRYTINIEAVRRKEPYARPIAFYNADIALMKEYNHHVTFFNFKNGSVARLPLKNSSNHACFPFQSDFEPCDLMDGFSLKHLQGGRGRSKSKRTKWQLGLGQYFALSPKNLFLFLLLAFSFFCFGSRSVDSQITVVED